MPERLSEGSTREVKDEVEIRRPACPPKPRPKGGVKEEGRRTTALAIVLVELVERLKV